MGSSHRCRSDEIELCGWGNALVLNSYLFVAGPRCQKSIESYFFNES